MQAYGGLMSITGEDENAAADPRSRLDDRHGLGHVGGHRHPGEPDRAREDGPRRARRDFALRNRARLRRRCQIASVTIAPRQMKPQGSGASGIVPYQAFRASRRLDRDRRRQRRPLREAREGARPARARRRRALRDERASASKNRKALIPLLEAEVAKYTIAEVRELLDARGRPERARCSASTRSCTTSRRRRSASSSKGPKARCRRSACRCASTECVRHMNALPRNLARTEASSSLAARGHSGRIRAVYPGAI